MTETDETRWKLAAACSRDGIFDIDLVKGRAFLSQRLREILKWPPDVEEDLMFDPRMWRCFFHPDDGERWNERIEEARAFEDDRYIVHTETRVKGGDGEYRWVAANYMILKDKSGEPYRLVGAAQDMQERRAREDAIRLQATHDQLTGLPNRYLYNDRLAQQMLAATRGGTSIVLGVWDLDGFKGVNDTYGHLAGDRMLAVVADRIRLCLREADTLARFGGDEFVMLLAAPRGKEREVAAVTTGRIFAALGRPVDLGPVSVSIGASCGMAFFPEHADSPKALFDLADRALLLAKRKGKLGTEVWTPLH